MRRTADAVSEPDSGQRGQSAYAGYDGVRQQSLERNAHACGGRCVAVMLCGGLGLGLLLAMDREVGRHARR